MLSNGAYIIPTQCFVTSQPPEADLDNIRGGVLGAKAGYTKIRKVGKTQLNLVQSISKGFLSVQIKVILCAQHALAKGLGHAPPENIANYI